MKSKLPSLLLLTAMTLPVANAHADDSARHQRCKRVHADLIEISSTEGCNPGLNSCFLGVVDGNRGLDGTAHFYSDSAAAGPSGSPGFVSYSGEFEYRTAKGTIYAHETGVTDPGTVTAYQQIHDGTGRYDGATGYFFVSGFKSDIGGETLVDTEVTGEICYPRRRSD